MLKLLRFVWSHPLNAGSRVSALARVLQWQAASRLMAGPIAFPFVEGTRLFAARGMTGATGNWYCGLHEHEEMGFVLHLLRPNECFVDVGANIGSYTVLASGAAGARTVAVEPIPAAFDHLRRNVLLNALQDRVRTCRVGLSDKAGRLRFSSDQDTVNHVLAEGENLPAIEVPVLPLDDLLVGDSPTLIKIDVEGYELPVLKGGSSTLSKPSLLAVIMETNGSGARYGVADSSLVETMAESGFQPFGYDPLSRSLTSPKGGNTVFVRSRAEVESRVRSARRFRLINGEI